ncbi:hypothetical protein GCM10011339_00260 [Echinicola rosea]|uniref:Uncharacterized protein n=1 Tax=Echinicola rosea TaxID=1807691 RepID=A0ABQ1UGU0_9BACT|nr:hypothetical protein GCM10011339_00260 [Echinicola rosea]
MKGSNQMKGKGEIPRSITYAPMAVGQIFAVKFIGSHGWDENIEVGLVVY